MRMRLPTVNTKTRLLPYPTGSRVICSNPPDTSDWDYVVLVPNKEKAIEDLASDGWDINVDDPEYHHNMNREYPFVTARRGMDNLIIYDDIRGYDLWVTATELATKFRLESKVDRIDLFRAIMNDRV